MPLIIRSAQMHVFEALAREDLALRLRAALLSAYPAICSQLGDSGLDSRVRHGMEKARRYGLRTEADYADFLYLTFRLSPDFETDPEYIWAKRILEMPKLKGETKVAAIRARLAPREKPAE